MSEKRLVVVGGVAAGTKAASKAKREHPDWEVIVFTKDKDVSYAGCGLPYFTGGVIKEREELVVRGPQEFMDEQGIFVLTGRDVTEVNPEAKTVRFKELENGEEHTITYDYLVLATGASPFFPPIEGIKLGNIFPLRTIDHAEAVRTLLEEGTVREAVVVGAGFIGLETAENLALRGIKVTILEMAPLILPGYDEEISLYIKNYLLEKGVQVLTGVKVEGFVGDEENRVRGVKAGEQLIPAQCVIWAGGVRPNVELALKAGLEIGPTRTIAVNQYQETSHPDIYAVGDCTENRNLITGQPAWFALGSTANKTGRNAGLNIGRREGEAKTALPGVLGTSIIKLFELNAARTGLTEEQARELGYHVESVIVPANDRAHYYPGYRQIITKLIADADTKKVLGIQVVGEGVVDKPVDIAATLITCGGTLETMAQLDLAYAPPFSMAIGSNILAAHVLLNKIQGRFKGINPKELQPLLEREEAVAVDVRTEEEYFLRAIPGSLNIPKNQVTARYREIPADKKIVLICKSGKRAYLVYDTFIRLGFTDVCILEGGLDAYPYPVE